MSQSIHKVTCFITRLGNHGTELLLFRHPSAGVQIPAGTVEVDEDPISAARREAEEETGLNNLVLLRFLGTADDPLPAGYLVVAQPTRVYSRPDSASFNWAHFHRRLKVEILRREGGFTQVRYEEKDRVSEPQYTTYCITGWVPEETLTDQRIRHFYLFDAPGPTPDQWTVNTDNHVFNLFWSPINALPEIVPPQYGWLKYLLG